MPRGVLTERTAPLFAKPALMEWDRTAFKDKGDSRPRLRLRGQILQAVDKPNANHRKYGRRVWENNFRNDSSFMRRLGERRVIGQLEHPSSGTSDLSQGSHVIESVRIETIKEGNPHGVEPGEYVVGDVLVMLTPQGLILEEYFKCGCCVGCSSRGEGETLAGGDGIEEVKDDFQLTTWDYVTDQSVKEALHKLREAAGDVPAGGAVDIAGEPPIAGERSLPPMGGGGASDPEIIAGAEALVREMEDSLANDVDNKELSNIVSRVLTMLNTMGTDVSPEGSTLRGQLLALGKVVAQKLSVNVGGSKKAASEDEGAKAHEENEKEEKAAAPKEAVKPVAVPKTVVEVQAPKMPVAARPYTTLGTSRTERRSKLMSGTVAGTEVAVHLAERVAALTKEVKELKADSSKGTRYDALKRVAEDFRVGKVKAERKATLAEAKYAEALRMLRELRTRMKGAAPVVEDAPDETKPVEAVETKVEEPKTETTPVVESKVEAAPAARVPTLMEMTQR